MNAAAMRPWRAPWTRSAWTGRCIMARRCCGPALCKPAKASAIASTRRMRAPAVNACAPRPSRRCRPPARRPRPTGRQTPCPTPSTALLRPATPCGRYGPRAKRRPATGWTPLPTASSTPTRMSATSRPCPPPVACRPIWRRACYPPARRCARRWRPTMASWTAARRARPHGSTNCCGASSTSICWPPIRRCPCTSP
ncbi:hypothetical protein D3C73_860690 [compost metagenome]